MIYMHGSVLRGGKCMKTVKANVKETAAGTTEATKATKTPSKRAVRKAEPAAKAAEEKVTEVTEATEEKTAEKAPAAKSTAKTKAAKTAAKPAAKPAAEKAPVEKKPAAKKAPANKAVVKETIFLQYLGKEINVEDITKQAKEHWTKVLKNKAADIKSIDVYLKPEENAAYFVINGDVTGNVYL